MDRNPQSDQVPSVDHYNNALTCNKSLLDTEHLLANGLANGYIPGNAFFPKSIIQALWFPYISTQNLVQQKDLACSRC